ncbi:hypothetical protein BUALT_Bualt03G0123100 [Buddleja alternifolia]|uniref:Uncharacterized protein n=1 Tax=Buddleja alternifolia TaxID=168488 RepID=A0AAV6XTW7_9LAMI|nr:hypothetical protein BUALT_Bualt03G0123100 [Buddleja alternifolia]
MKRCTERCGGVGRSGSRNGRVVWDQKDESFHTVGWACNIDGSPFLVAGGLKMGLSALLIQAMRRYIRGNNLNTDSPVLIKRNSNENHLFICTWQFKCQIYSQKKKVNPKESTRKFVQTAGVEATRPTENRLWGGSDSMEDRRFDEVQQPRDDVLVTREEDEE